MDTMQPTDCLPPVGDAWTGWHATTARYRVPDTTRQRRLIDLALAEIRRDAAIDRARWAAYAAAAREAGVL